MNNYNSKTVLTVQDLMDILRISKNTAYNLVRQHKIRSIKAGSQYRIPIQALNEFLNA